MDRKKTMYVLMLVGAIAASGCMKERNIVGRWESGSTQFHFRRDGILVFRSASDEQYTGRYNVEYSTFPKMHVESQLLTTNGGPGTVTIEFEAELVGPDRMRTEDPNGSMTIFARVADDET